LTRKEPDCATGAISSQAVFANEIRHRLSVFGRKTMAAKRRAVLGSCEPQSALAWSGEQGQEIPAFRRFFAEMDEGVMLPRRRERHASMLPRRMASRAIAGSVLCFGLTLWRGEARAQYSAHDGYTENGGYQVHVELTPYLWLPATTGTLSVGGSFAGQDVSFGSGPPSVPDLAHSLHGALVAFGLVRYGPWSAELDFQWIDAFHKSTFQPNVFGPALGLSDTVRFYRVAPGVGYQVYSGYLGATPITVDARAGFSVFSWNATANITQTLAPGVSVSHSFAQPWAGFRADFYPWTDWRFEIAANAEGFGVDGGVWGWGASGLVYYSINRWLDVAGGIRALSSRGRGNGSGPFARSLNITTYGPVLGVGIRF
jgi:hypothetical protein